MTDEMKPVNCGCGGEASMCCGFEHRNIYAVECNKCGICTCEYETEAEAIEAWNRAMGADQFREVTKKIERTENVHECAENAQCKERTAKVKKQFVLVTGGLGGVMPSCECGWAVNEEWKYCPACGCRLIWGDD